MDYLTPENDILTGLMRLTKKNYAQTRFDALRPDTEDERPITPFGDIDLRGFAKHARRGGADELDILKEASKLTHMHMEDCYREIHAPRIGLFDRCPGPGVPLPFYKRYDV